MHLHLTDGREFYDARVQTGQECIEAAAGGTHVSHDDDREMYGTDAISDILTALFGPAGHYEGDTPTRRVNHEEALSKAQALLAQAFHSYEGDAQDYQAATEEAKVWKLPPVTAEEQKILDVLRSCDRFDFSSLMARRAVESLAEKGYLNVQHDQNGEPVFFQITRVGLNLVKPFPWKQPDDWITLEEK